MALADWTIIPLSFTISENRADVICSFANSVTLKTFKEHVLCFGLESLKTAVLTRIAVLDQTDPTADLKPALTLPLDFTPAPPTPLTPFDKFALQVRTQIHMAEAIRLGDKTIADPDWLALQASVTADLLANPDFIDAF